MVLLSKNRAVLIAVVAQSDTVLADDEVAARDLPTDEKRFSVGLLSYEHHQTVRRGVDNRARDREGAPM
jgi:hypothetical protein